MFIGFIILFSTLFFNLLSVLLNRFSILGKYLKMILLLSNVFSFIFIGFIIVYCVTPSNFNHPNMYKNIFSILFMYILMLLNTIVFRMIYKTGYIIIAINIVIIIFTLYYFISQSQYNYTESMLKYDIVPAPISNIITNIVLSVSFILFLIICD